MRPRTAQQVINRHGLVITGRPAEDVETELLAYHLTVKRVSSSDTATTLEYAASQVRLIVDDKTGVVKRYLCG